MRALTVACVGCVLASFGFSRQLTAQESNPRNQLALDASILAVGLSYAHVTSATRLVGIGAGAGTEFDLRMVRGESWGDLSAELLHLEVFERFETAGRWQYDLGMKAAADIHSQAVHGQSGSEQDFGGFLGGYIAPMWSWHQLRIGPRVQAGVYWAPNASFGVGVTPLVARFLFRF